PIHGERAHRHEVRSGDGHAGSYRERAKPHLFPVDGGFLPRLQLVGVLQIGNVPARRAAVTSLGRAVLNEHDVRNRIVRSAWRQIPRARRLSVTLVAIAWARLAD